MTTPVKRCETVVLRKDRIHANTQAGPARSVRVLIAADDSRTMQSLGSSLDSWGYETMVVFNDKELLHRMEREAHASLVILDGAMQGVDSLALCRRIRLSPDMARAYIILLTADWADGQPFPDPSRGPDDLLARPYTRTELHARVRTGMRVMDLETEVSRLAKDLARAANKIEKLGGLLPICSHCKKIRDDTGYWNELEKYISDHSDAEFSHAICPACLAKYYPDVKDESL
jgi:sigma-B regulation protein RsbU (phosphoserine phosphatase)